MELPVLGFVTVPFHPEAAGEVEAAAVRPGWEMASPWAVKSASEAEWALRPWW